MNLKNYTNPFSPNALGKDEVENKTNFFKTTVLMLLVLLGWNASWGQILTEDFTGLTTGNLGTQNSWVQNGSGTDVQVASTTPISYNGYNSLGGNYITITRTNGIDPHKVFSSTVATTSASTFYYSFLVNVNSATTTATTATAPYSLSLRNSANTAYFGRFFIGKDASNNLKFGASVQGGDGSGTYASGTYSFGGSNTYLIVIRYDIGSTTDNMYMWVNPSLTSEPAIASADVTITGATKPVYGTPINCLMIHTRSSTISPAASLDGFRVSNASTSATAWTNLAANRAISNSPTSLTGFSTTSGSASAAQTFTITGTNLATTANNLVVTAPSNYEIRDNSDGGSYSSSVSFTPAGSSYSKTIDVRISSSASVG